VDTWCTECAVIEDRPWADTLAQCNRLTRLVERDAEVAVAKHMKERCAGFGPKQSRNLLQSRGLNRRDPNSGVSKEALGCGNWRVKDAHSVLEL